MHYTARDGRHSTKAVPSGSTGASNAAFTSCASHPTTNRVANSTDGNTPSSLIAAAASAPR